MRVRWGYCSCTPENSDDDEDSNEEDGEEYFEYPDEAVYRDDGAR